MTAQQRDTIDQILRNAPFDLGGDVATQRPLLDQMLTSQPLEVAQMGFPHKTGQPLRSFLIVPRLLELHR
jgi:hypothetical protein